MRKIIFFYFLAFIMLVAVFVFFINAYRQMGLYSSFVSRTNLVYRGFEQLDMQICNAAVIYPALLKADTEQHSAGLFFADSAILVNQVAYIKATIRDSVNIGITRQLDSCIKAELPWLLASNVPDSILAHKGLIHVEAIKNINALITAALERTGFLLKYHNANLHSAVQRAKAGMFTFILLSGICILSFGGGFLKQKSRTFIQQGQLQQSEEKYRHALDNMMEGIQIIDYNWNYLYVNEAVSRQGHYPRQQMLGKSIMALYPGVEKTELYQVLTECMKNRVPKRLKNYFTFPDKSVSFFELSIQPIPEGILILSMDITERKNAEEELQQTINELSHYKKALDASSIVATTDHQGIIRQVNDNFCKISGYSRGELIGQDHRIINSGYHTREFIKNLWGTIAKGGIWRGEIRNRAKDGSYYWVDTTIVPFLNVAGKPYQYLAIRTDITPRIKKREELAKINRLYSFISAINQSIVHIADRRQLLDNACNIATGIGNFKTAWIAMLDGAGHINIVASANSQPLSHLPLPPGIDYNNSANANLPVVRVLKTGAYIIVNDVAQDGSVSQWKKELIKNGIQSGIVLPIVVEGKVIGAFGLHSEIKDFFDPQEVALLEEAAGDISFALEVMERENRRRHAEAEIIASAERLKRAQSIAHIGHWELNFASGKALWSDESCRIYGLDVSDNIQSYQLWLSFVHPDDLEHVMQCTTRQHQQLSSAAFNYRIQRRDGSIRYIHCESQFEMDDAGKPVGLYGIVHDVTEHTVAQRAIVESEARLSAIIENTDAYIYSLNTEFRYVAFNSVLKNTLKQFYGLDIKQGDKIFEYLQTLDPSDARDWEEKYTEALKGKSLQFVKEYIVNGFKTYSSFSIHPIWQDGAVIGLSCFGRDITQQKLAEAQILSLNQTLEQKVKDRTAELEEANREMETFSYSVSHDLQSPLRTLSSFSHILVRKYSTMLDNEGRECLELIDSNARRMAGLIQDLLKFSKLGRAPVQRNNINMTELAGVIINEVKRDSRQLNAEIKLNNLMPAQCDAALIRQVWSNLIGNAVKYSSKKEHPVIEIGMKEENNCPVYYVKDNGAGFDMKYADKLFNVFQRLHTVQEFEGTGVGLATVQRIIVKHGGRIWADSKVNEGATFYFTLQ